MPNKALVINPWITDFKLYDEWMHPLGIYFLISLLKHNNWDITYINCLDRTEESKPKKYGTGTFPAVKLEKPPLYKHIHRKYKRYGISEEAFIKKLATVSNPDVIFIGSSMTYWIGGVVATVRQVREIFPDTPIILGGISATLIPEIINSYLPNVTVYPGPVLGNIDSFQNAHPTLAHVSTQGWQPSLADAFALNNKPFHGPLLTSFGCPLRCTYCASTLLQKTFQRRSHETVMHEIQYLTEKCGVIDFACYDDALLYQSENHFIPLTRAISQLDATIRIHVPNGLHVRWLDENALAAMKKCGFVTLRFGYESSNVKHMKDTNAKANRMELVQKISLVKSAAFVSKDIGIYIMAGLPGQTVEDVMDEVSFAASLGIQVKPVFLSPVPHTKLFSRYAERFPQLTMDPLFHNDTFFITQLPGWSYTAVEEVKGQVREINRNL